MAVFVARVGLVGVEYAVNASSGTKQIQEGMPISCQTHRYEKSLPRV